MTREESLEITARIGVAIANDAPCISYTSEDLKEARREYSNTKLQELELRGFYQGDFELFYCTKCLADQLDLWQYADGKYLKKLFSVARKFHRDQFYKDPYLSQIKISKRKIENILLTEGVYKRGEFFQYDMPRLNEKRLYNTEFRYWIGEEIRWYRERTKNS